jgi:hypothetical protein
MALQTAIAEFDHDEDWKHDEELDLHADKILFQKLALCFLSDPGSEEVAMICTALEMVYRASRQRIALSFSELRESVLPIFVNILNQPLRFRKLEQLEQVVMEAAKKNSTPFHKTIDESFIAHEKSIRGESMQDSATTFDDISKNQKATFEDDPTHATFDDYPKKTKIVDDNDSYATYDDDYPKKSYATDEGHNSYVTYDDDYPKKSNATDEEHNSYATYDDDYPKKSNATDEEHNSYATYDDDYPKKSNATDEEHNSYATYDDDYPKKSNATDEEHNSYATYDDDYPKKSKYVDKGNYSFATDDDGYERKGKSGDDIYDDSYATYDPALVKATLAYPRTESDSQGSDSRGKNNQHDASTQNADQHAHASGIGGKESNRLVCHDQETRATTCSINQDLPCAKQDTGDTTSAPPTDQYEVETVMSDGSYSNAQDKPKASNDQRKNEDDKSEYTEYTQQREYFKQQQRDDATIYTTDNVQTFVEDKHEGDLDTIGEGSTESDTKYSQSFAVENSFSKNQSFASPSVQPTKTKVAQSVTTVSTHSRNLKEKKRQQEQGGNTVIQCLEAELELIRFDTPTHPIAIGRSLQVLRYFSRVLSAMVQLAHHPGMLDALVYQLERQPYGKHKQHFYEYPNGEPRQEEEMDEMQAARIDAIATIVNLACAEENKCIIANHRGLLDSVTSVAHFDDSEEAREHAAIVIMNLAYEDENKVCCHIYIQDLFDCMLELTHSHFDLK